MRRPALLLALALVACGTPADEAAVRPAPTEVPDSLPDDAPTAAELAAARARLTASESADTTAQAAAPPTDAAIDSLRGEVARLTAALNTLLLAEIERRQSAEADTAAASLGEKGQEVRAEAQEFGRSLLTNLFWAAVVLTLTYLFVRGLVGLIEALAERDAARRLFFKRLLPIVRLAVWSAAAYFILTVVFDVNRTSLLTASAAAGIAIGFAAQDVLKNIFGGALLIFDQPFQVGDKIAVGGTYGEVVSIGLRSTRIVTPDDNLVSIPNAQVVENQVANANAGALDCQVVVDLYLPGWTDVARAKRIAYEAAAASRYVFLDKPVVVNVKDEFKETFLTHLKVKAYVLDTRYEFAFASDVTETAKAGFLEAGLMAPMAGGRFWVPPAPDAPPSGDGAPEAGR